MVKPLQNVIIWKVGGYPNIFFQEICSSVGKQLSLSKTAILEHP